MRAIAKTILTGISIYLVLVYLALIPKRQSAVLALIFGMLFQYASRAAAKPILRFTPYRVIVLPKWYEILTDFHLLQKPEDWTTVRDSGEHVEQWQFSIFRDPLCFSVVQQSADGEQMLIYFDSYRSFISEVDFLEDLNPISIIRENETSERLRKQTVHFFVKYGTGGYQLGLELPAWWWDKNKASCPPVVSEDKEHSTGTVRVVLSVVSYREFDVYWHPINWSEGFIERVNKRRDEHRTKFGWVADEGLHAHDLPIHWPTEINNRYFALRHSDV